MYPLCCIDIRNFLNQFYFFSDDHFQQPNVIDETLKKVRLHMNYSCENSHAYELVSLSINFFRTRFANP